jgi:hypothetical protein
MIEISRRKLLLGAAAAGLPGCGALGPRFGGEAQFPPQAMSQLKQKTAVFVLHKYDVPYAEQFRSALTRAWTFSPIEVVAGADVNRYADESRYAYFTVDLLTEAVSYSPDWTQVYHHAALVFVNSLRENAQIEGYCRLPLGDVWLPKDAPRDQRPATGEDERFYNWTPAMLSLYLRSIQLDLENGRRRWFYKSSPKSRELLRLADSTLYAPDHVLRRFDDGQEIQPFHPLELFGGYPYKYQILPPEPLLGVITDQPDALVFDYVKSSTDKFISVYSFKSGLLYRHYSPMSKNIESNDVMRILG